MQWSTFEEFKNEIPHNTAYVSKHNVIIKANKIVVENLHRKFRSPEKWLLAPIQDKRFRHNTYATELKYILFWAWQHKIYLCSEYKQYLYDYLEEVYSRSGTATEIKNWLKLHNLLLENEYDLFNNTKSLKAPVFLSLFLMKPFAEITDEELDETPLIYKKPFTKKRINDVRIQLGYTNKIVKADRSNRSNWEKTLFVNPLWGEMFKEYHQYLIGAGAKKGYIRDISTNLNILMEYLKTRSISDCSQFTWIEFKDLTEFICETRSVSTAVQAIAKLKKFFLWGNMHNSFFPKNLSFPESYWKSLNKKSKEYHKTSNGRAFQHKDIANEIVKILISLKPENEEEQICLYFWRIIISCPSRFSYVLNLEANSALQRLPNEPDAYGLYSSNADKAGTKSGQFPILDQLGIDAILALQIRAKTNNFKPIYNDRYERSYIHLFHLPHSPWLLSDDMLWNFFNTKIKINVSSILELENSFMGGAHGFRHYILTEILKETGSLEAAQIAGGHKHSSMTRLYIKSIHAKEALLYRAIDKYETGEITGKFYLKLIEALTSNEPTTELMKDLTKQITMDEFIKKHGRKTEMGLCFDEDGTCANYLKCWNCPSFMMRKSEIDGAVQLLRKLTFEFIALKDESLDFSYDNAIAQNKITPIALIKERLVDLKIPEEDIMSMVFDN